MLLNSKNPSSNCYQLVPIETKHFRCFVLQCQIPDRMLKIDKLQYTTDLMAAKYMTESEAQ